MLLHQLFERRADQAPDAEALRWDGGRLTYGELERRANGLAHELRARGVGPEVLVGLALDRSAEAVVAILGVLKAGGAFVPIDPAYPAERRAFMLAETRAALVLDRLPDGAGSETRLPGGDERSLAYVIFTSGSTGQPKGIALEHRGVVSNLEDLNGRFAVGAGDRIAWVSSPGFDMSVYEVLGTLAAGATLIVPDASRGRDPAYLAELVAKRRITVWNSAPALLDALVTHELARPSDRLRSVRLALLGGDWVPVKLPARLRAVSPSATLVALGGATEASIHSTIYVVREVDPAWRSIPYGVAMARQETRILDEDRRPAAEGELYLGGIGLARGYYGRPELTAERFVTVDGERLYRTGDRVRRRPDGNLELLGRIDHQIKIRGVRIEPGEIEAALAAHPAVERAVVGAREDASGERRLVAWVVPVERAPGLERTLARHLRARLPDALVPRAFVLLDRLPLSPNGKVDRAALPAPGRKRALASAAYVAPRTPVEAELAGLAGELLELDEVGLDDDLVELGAHSLALARLGARIRDRLGAELPVHELLAAPTVAQLAAKIAGGRAGEAAPIGRAPDGPLPAAPGQERLWYLEQLFTSARPYNELLAIRLDGPLDEPRLREAFAALIAQHAALRTRLELRDGRLMQRGGEPTHDWSAVDLTGRADRDTALAALAKAEGRRPFDLERGPVVRSQLVRLSASEHVLLVGLHHVVTDGWSDALLTRELAARYAGEAPAAPPLEFRDFTAWQRAQPGRVAGEVERLRGAATMLALPFDRPRRAIARFHGGRVPLALPPDVSQAVRSLARGEQATPYVILLAAFEALLARWSGQDDFLVGTIRAHRPRPELERVLGFFADTRVVRARLDDDPSFRVLVSRARAEWLALTEAGEVPFDALVQALGAARDRARNPLFQTLFVHHNWPPASARAGELRFQLELADTGTAKLDLTLSLHERDGGFDGWLEYDSDLFDAATVERLAKSFGALLGAATQDPDERVSRLALGGESTLVGAPAILASALTRFEAAVDRTPDAIALEQGAESLSYRELDERANRLAHRLRALGCTRETTVAVALPRSFDAVAAMLAVWKAGGAWVPIDPAHPAARNDWLLEDCGAPLAIAECDVPAAIRRVRPSDAASEPTTRLHHAPAPADLAYLIYTSGSTGRPKAVMIEQAALGNYLAWAVETYGIAASGGALVQSSFGFDLAITSLFGPLTCGRAVRLLPAERGGESFADLVREGGGDRLIKLTPTELDLLASGLSPSEAQQVAPALVIGGEALRGASLGFWRNHAPRTRLFNEYGPTETVVGCSVHEITPGQPLEDRIPIGRPIAGARLYVLDAALQPVPRGVPGELCVGGAGVGRGYHARPELTAGAFVADPFHPGGRLYRTGDRARLRADGTLELLGRFDAQLKLRGFRIEPGEIEAALRRHPGVREAAAGLDARGELAAWVVAPAISAAALAAFLREQLPPWMVPAGIALLEALPRAASGKLNRAALPDAPPVAALSAVAPRNPVEKLVAASWADLLGMPSVGVLDDFFEMGGNSLQAIQAIARLRAFFKVEVTLRELLHAPTVAGIADCLLRDPARRATIEAAARELLRQADAG